MQVNGIYAVLFCFTIVSGCIAPTEAPKNDPALTLEYVSATMGVNSYIQVGITGGTPPYRVKSVSDSSRISAYAYYDQYRTAHRLELNTKNQLGLTTVVVQDSVGVIGSIKIYVVEFAMFPDAIEMMENSSQLIRIQGGTPPYSLTGITDTNVVEPFCNNYLSIFSRNAGSTSVTIVDSSPQKKRTSIQVNVRAWKSFSPGIISFSSTFGDHRFEGMLDPFRYPQTGSGAAGVGWRDWAGMNEYTYCIGTNLSPDGWVDYLNISIDSYGKTLSAGPYRISNVGIYPDPYDFGNRITVSYTSYQIVSDTVNRSVSYYLTSGGVSITSMEAGRLKGSFYGEGFTGGGIRGIDSTKPVSLWNGVFDIPYVIEVVHRQSGIEPMDARIQKVFSRNGLLLRKYLH